MMRVILMLVAIAALVASAADPAAARQKHSRVQARCVDRPYEFSWRFLLPGQPEPRPNGCAPAVYAYGKFVGQDPDPNIRFQLRRDPATGYSALNNN